MLSALLVAGCSDSSDPSASGTPTPTESPTALACPGANAPTEIVDWPAPVPSDLPRPPSSRRVTVAHPSKQVTVVRFTSSLALRDAVLFMLKELPAKGFTIGRGDDEPTEADVPFGRNGFFGQLRMVAVTPCRTEWLVAVGAPKSGNVPLLPPPTSSPGPLPTFG